MLENDILPGFSPDDVAIVAIHCHPDGRATASHVQWFGLTFPVALDIDSEMFRRFRLPEHVFPLNLVIDRNGDVAYLGTSLDEAVGEVAAQLAAATE